ncbi:hypothetical protein [Sphingobacterium daejeonense]|uniref:hypothetical protein n=1 Tax=Sphingobacterium daejeonense TaxID=371142 RepID=UPI0010C55E60|nr:hypothetical protein [Sphingobacterium daejeonense]VTP99394.1 ribosomal protein L11 methyltransferase [Sphingobacterium daejeonense]
MKQSLGSKEVIVGLRFDMVLANINRNILLDQFDVYASDLPDAGELYISGFYDGEDLEILREKAETLGVSICREKSTGHVVCS